MKNKNVIFILLGIFILASVSVYAVFSHKPYAPPAAVVASSEAVETHSSTSTAATTSDSEGSAASSTDIAQTNIYDGTAPVISEMKEPLIINSFISENEQERLAMTYDKGLINCGWEGEMKFTITSATMYNTFEETGIADTVANVMPDEIEGDPPKYFIINMDIENISASIPASYEADTFRLNVLLETNNEFSQENFKEMLRRTNRYPWLHYFSLHGQTEKNYYQFALPQGSTASAQLGFFVSQKALESQKLILSMGYTGAVRAYGIELNEIADHTKGMEKSASASQS